MKNIWILLLMIVSGIISCNNPSVSQNLPNNVPEDGLIGWWPLDGNAKDLSLNKNDGTTYKTLNCVNRVGETNRALSFDGYQSYIVVPNSESLNPTSFSIAGWYYSDEEATDLHYGAKAIFTKWFQEVNCYSNSDNYNIQLSKIDNINSLIGVTSIQHKSVGSIKENSRSIQPNQWVHFIMIHDEKKGESLYINGKLVQTLKNDGKLCPTANNVFFGVDNKFGSFWRFFKGKLDDFGMWKRPLTEKEISNLYNPEVIITVQIEKCSEPIVYPNPFLEIINLKLDSCIIGSYYTIYDGIGKRVEDGVLKQEITKLNFVNYPNGIYALRINDIKSTTFKIIKYY